MAKYKIIFAKRVDQMLLRHVEFLSRVSVPAAKQLYREFEKIIRRLEDNPYQFSPEEDQNLPVGYRKAIFAKRYKAVFLVKESVVYLDAVVDCRMDSRNVF